MSAVITIAIDVGSGVTKAKTAGASAEFLSLAGPPLPEVFSLSKDPSAYVSVGDQVFCVGERALSAVRPADITDSRTDSWHLTPAYLSLLYAGMAAVLPPAYSGRVRLATGLPIGFYRDAKDTLVEALVGEHRFSCGGHSYKVVLRRPDFFVLPQALGLFLRHLELAPESHEGRCGFIDVGTYTSGFLQTENFALLQYATGSARVGVGDIKAGLSAWLTETYGMHVTRSTIEGALATGRIRVGTESVDLRDAIADIAMRCSEPLRVALRASWGAAKESSILVGGGGGQLLLASVKTAFPHARLLETPKPHLSVVEGFYNYAKSKGPTPVAASVA
jgi:plasmid segregation protein ParM